MVGFSKRTKDNIHGYFIGMALIQISKNLLLTQGGKLIPKLPFFLIAVGYTMRDKVTIMLKINLNQSLDKALSAMLLKQVQKLQLPEECLNFEGISFSLYPRTNKSCFHTTFSSGKGTNLNTLITFNLEIGISLCSTTNSINKKSYPLSHLRHVSHRSHLHHIFLRSHLRCISLCRMQKQREKLNQHMKGWLKSKQNQNLLLKEHQNCKKSTKLLKEMLKNGINELEE